MVLCISHHYLLYNQNSDSENDSMFYSSSLNAKGTNPPEGLKIDGNIVLPPSRFRRYYCNALDTSKRCQIQRSEPLYTRNRVTQGHPHQRISELETTASKVRRSYPARQTNAMFAETWRCRCDDKNFPLNCHSSNLGTFLAHIVFM